MDREVITLVADIIGSRRVKNRDELNLTLRKTIEELNTDRYNILSPYTLTLGDEVQVVFSKAHRLFQDAITLLAALHPTKMRFSYGIGTLVTPINQAQAIGMDGPAFHRARDGIDQLKRSRELFIVAAPHLSQTILINHSLRLISHNIRDWNETRLKTFALIYKDLSVQDIAARLDLTDKAIYKTIRVGALHETKDLFDEIERLINNELRF